MCISFHFLDLPAFDEGKDAWSQGKKLDESESETGYLSFPTFDHD
jgi:hypothetical protein